jgi:hypothetical protein
LSSGKLSRAIAVCLSVVTGSTAAHAFCPPGSVAAPHAYGQIQGVIACICPDGSLANFGIPCPSPGGHAPGPPSIGPQAWDWRAQLDHAFRAIKDYLDRNRAYEDPREALSVQSARQPWRPPPNQVAQDAFERLIRSPPPPPPNSNPVTVLQPGQPATDPFTGSIATIQPQQSPQTAPLAASSPPSGSYAACAGASTFGGLNPAYCEMGGYVYLQNGTVLRAH